MKKLTLDDLLHKSRDSLKKKKTFFEYAGLTENDVVPLPGLLGMNDRFDLPLRVQTSKLLTVHQLDSESYR